MKKIGIGLIGTGFMGKAHAMAYAAAAGVFPNLPLHPELVAVADINKAAAEKSASQFGFQRATTEWQSLIADPSIEVISITTPNMLHREMAIAAAKAGKHIHCEKPLAPSVKDAAEMVKAAEAAGVVTQVGYNYIKNPLLKLAKQMIADGELGEVVNFRGIHAEDYMADPAIPYNWRVDGSGGSGGAISEIGSHIIGMARFLVGPIVELSADLKTLMKTRPAATASAERKEVKVDDVAQMIVRFAGGFGGTIEANWLAIGRKMQLGFEITGTKGSLAFTQERLNELLYFRAGDNARTSGFVRIESGPQHAPYGEFCPAPGHQLGSETSRQSRWRSSSPRSPEASVLDLTSPKRCRFSVSSTRWSIRPKIAAGSRFDQRHHISLVRTIRPYLRRQERTPLTAFVESGFAALSHAVMAARGAHDDRSSEGCNYIKQEGLIPLRFSSAPVELPAASIRSRSGRPVRTSWDPRSRARTRSPCPTVTSCAGSGAPVTCARRRASAESCCPLPAACAAGCAC